METIFYVHCPPSKGNSVKIIHTKKEEKEERKILLVKKN